MNRRGFLGLLVSVSAVEDPERLLWRPGQKRIFIPPPRVVFTGDWFNVRFKAGYDVAEIPDGPISRASMYFRDQRVFRLMNQIPGELAARLPVTPAGVPEVFTVSEYPIRQMQIWPRPTRDVSVVIEYDRPGKRFWR